MPGGTLTYPIASNGAFLAFIPRGTQTITATSTGFSSAGVTLTYGPGPRSGVVISLNGPAGEVRGVVRNAVDGRAVVGATVTVSGGGSTTSDAQGGFYFASAPSGARTISVTAGNYEPGSTTTTICPDATAYPVISLQPLGNLAGVVTDAICHNPIASAVITISNGRTTATGGNGAYLLSSVRVGTYAVSAAAPSFVTGVSSTTIVIGQTTTLNFSLQGGPGGTVTGRVTDASSGAGISGATVQIAGGASTTTSGTSTYSIPNVTPGSTTIQITAAGYQGTTLYGTLCPSGTLTGNAALVRLTGSLTGTVTDANTGALISGASVSLGSGDGTMTGSNGAYSFTGLAPGATTLTVTRTGYQSRTLNITIVAGANPPINVALTPVSTTGTLTGTVTDSSTSAPISGATVSVGTGQSTTTASNGTYTLNNVPAGATTITAARTGYQSKTQNITVVAGNNPAINIALTPVPATGTVPGIVTDCTNGSPIAGASVSVTTGQSATTDGNGRFTLTNVPTGSNSISADRAGYVRKSQPITVFAGTNPQVAISLCPPTTANEIKIVLNWGAQPNDLDAHLSGPNGSGGRFHLFYPYKGSASPVPHASIDVDDQNAFGPETITIKKNPTTNKFVAGEYHYWIHNFSQTHGGGTAIGSASARVTINQGSSELEADPAPSNITQTLWYVVQITIDQNGTVTSLVIKNTAQDGTETTVL